MCMRIKILMFLKAHLLNMNIGMLLSCVVQCEIVILQGLL